MTRVAMCGVVLLLLVGASVYARAEPPDDHIAIIVSSRWQTPEEIPLPLLRRMYLGRITRWAGESIERYELPTGSAARSAFASVVFGRSERELEDYWLEQALTGGAIPPREVGTIEDMKTAIASRSGTIGYLPLRALSDRDRAELRVLALDLARETVAPGHERYPIRAPGLPPARPATPPAE